jgi:hypothetical protein
MICLGAVAREIAARGLERAGRKFFQQFARHDGGRAALPDPRLKPLACHDRHAFMPAPSVSEGRNVDRAPAKFQAVCQRVGRLAARAFQDHSLPLPARGFVWDFRNLGRDRPPRKQCGERRCLLRYRRQALSENGVGNGVAAAYGNSGKPGEEILDLPYAANKILAAVLSVVRQRHDFGGSFRRGYDLHDWRR